MPIAVMSGAINAEAGLAVYQAGAPQGGWYQPLRVAPSLMPGAASSVDAFAVLLYYGAGSYMGAKSSMGAEPSIGL